LWQDKGKWFQTKREDISIGYKEKGFVCLFTERGVRHWNRLPRDMADALSSETIKGQTELGSEPPDPACRYPCSLQGN